MATSDDGGVKEVRDTGLPVGAPVDGVWPSIGVVPPLLNGPRRADAERLTAVAACARDLDAALDETRDERELASRALRGALVALRADGGSLWLGDEGPLTCVAAEGRDAEALVDVELPASDVLATADEIGATALAVSLADRDGARPDARGVLRVAREGDAAMPFDATDRALLEAVAASAALALGAASRLRATDRGDDLALLAEMSREIASTLDLDRVLRAAVNLAARAIAFDRGALALYEDGACDIRAVAGADAVDAKAAAMQDLAVRGAWAAGAGEPFYLSDRTAPASDAERIFLQIFGDDLAAAGVGSGLYLPLKDEEGVVGILLFEAERADFADERQRELASILASQATVAIRNAQLYKQVPLADALGAFNVRRKALLGMPQRRRALLAGVAVAAIAALTLVRWPLRVVAAHPVFRPAGGGADARALVDGVIERVLVGEGAAVARGAPVAQLRDAAERADRDAALAAADADEREATLAASRGDAAQERMLRLRAETWRREASLADEQLRLTMVRAPVSGLVLTPHLEERIGARVAAGDPVLAVGGMDTLELEFGVEQRDVARVRVGDEVRLRVDALPQRTFAGRVVALGSLPSDTADGDVTFPVRAAVPNPDRLLRPGMVAQARVLTAPASLAGRLLRGPARTLRLLWWRMWS